MLFIGQRKATKAELDFILLSEGNDMKDNEWLIILGWENHLLNA